ncbi:hypothetical protein C8F04DRAFT_1256435 [Mycena alexandri]|uniref:Uncharacterized protein n=1 Tax=Mycena alexandri TaxID=1745969 RepID=A0AAD6T175_9AGAR|nr:hypothetical protein C8F04DRAFT_1256435 [Mycena alexandri]
MLTPNEDVFSCILSHVQEPKTLHAVLHALPKSHPLFSVALQRLFALPVYLDTVDAIVASGEIIDHLVAPDAGEVLAIQHLDIAAETARMGGDRFVVEASDVVAFRDRLSELFARTRNLKSISYHSYPGIPLSRENLDALATCERLHTLAVDTAVRQTNSEDYEALKDTETWNIEPLFIGLAPSLTSLELRHICMTTLNAIVSHKGALATCNNLEHLKLDITEGAWDWEDNWGGTPPVGASSEFVFPSLGLPAVRRLELVVSDLTVRRPRAGPLDLVDCTLLTDLSFDIRQGLYTDINSVEIFRALDAPALSHLEIKDNNTSASRQRLEWEPRREAHRFFPGLVDQFLGTLTSLSSLWVDQSALLPGHAESDWWGETHDFCGVRELWDSASTHYHAIEKASWRMALQTTLWQLESLRVGFRVVNGTEIGLVLGCCDPAKLRQFGFTWAWHEYGRDDPISPELLVHLARFPKLTDVHILFPRPETQVSGNPDPLIDVRMVHDVAAIFKSNGSICRVGMGNSLVWERSMGPEGVLTCDGSSAPDPLVPKFYHAGYLANRQEPLDEYDATPRRPGRTEEIGQLRDLLGRILGKEAEAKDVYPLPTLLGQR